MLKKCILIVVTFNLTVLAGPLNAETSITSRNITHCEHVDLNEVITIPEKYFEKVICFEGKLVNHAGVFNIFGRNASVADTTAHYTIQISGSNRQNQLLNEFATGTSLFFIGEIDVEEFFYDQKLREEDGNQTIDKVIYFKNFSVLFESLNVIDHVEKVNDYYTFNIKNCMTVKLKDVLDDPLFYNGKAICGYETLRTSGEYVFLSQEMENEHAWLLSERFISLDALYNDFVYLRDNMSGKKIYFYGVLDLPLVCWKEDICSPISKPLYLKFPNVTILDDVN